MNTHLTEDELVLHYYGELTSADDARTTTHLSECSTCHENFRGLQRVLAAIDENADRALAGPELPPHFERTVWAKLEPNLRLERGGWRSWLVLNPGRLAWVATVVLLVAAAFAAGRLMSPGGVANAPSSLNAAQIRERILLVDLSDHLDRSQMVLVELASADDQGTVDISDERTRAEQLLAANRLYRQTAVSSGDRSLAALLDDIERVLVDVAASPDHMSAQDLNEMRRRIESNGLLFKVRVVSSEVRQRQRSNVPGSVSTSSRPTI
jgi:hypothetical protein